MKKSKIIQIIIFFFFSTLFYSAHAESVEYVYPTGNTISTLDTFNSWAILTDFFEALPINGSRFCSVLGGNYLSGLSESRPWETSLNYNTTDLEWENSVNTTIFTQIICNIPVQAGNSFNNDLFDEESLRDIYEIQFVLCVFILLLNFVQYIVGAKLPIKFF